ncbi:4Fe-4S dicluster protein [Georgenia soli]|uniref:4Fe-4S dicluster protein n=1 Tax=Georgenia soli TaxID=638953 RepID=A0A2A9EQV1_9MICO|nr:4Fe-4S dicluster domain-containing protein [Georgenia soli]PFG40662.1 4Fe-4S dicluster protein [Georgenia soli]
MTAARGLRGVQAWLARQPEEAALEIVCAEHPGPSLGDRRRTVVRLEGCAAQVAPHEVVELLVLGAADVVLRLDGCADTGTARAHLAPLVDLLEASGVRRVRLVDGDAPEAPGPRARGLRRRRAVLDAAHMPVSRRQVLGLGDGVTRELPDEEVRPHRRLVAALAALTGEGSSGVAGPTEGLAGPTEGRAGPTEGRAGLPAPSVRLTARGCTACGVCVRGCPADALHLRHSAAGGAAVTTLLQDRAACDGCLRCVELCPDDVLSAAGAWSWEQALREDATAPVVTLTTARCGRCGSRFPTPSGQRLCPVCAFRRANPFGSRVPARAYSSSRSTARW